MVIRSDRGVLINSAGQLAQLCFQKVEIDRLAQRLRRTHLAGSAERNAAGASPFCRCSQGDIRISWVRGNLTGVPTRAKLSKWAGGEATAQAPLGRPTK